MRRRRAKSNGSVTGPGAPPNVTPRQLSGSARRLRARRQLLPPPPQERQPALPLQRQGARALRLSPRQRSRGQSRSPVLCQGQRRRPQAALFRGSQRSRRPALFLHLARNRPLAIPPRPQRSLPPILPRRPPAMRRQQPLRRLRRRRPFHRRLLRRHLPPAPPRGHRQRARAHGPLRRPGARPMRYRSHWCAHRRRAPAAPIAESQPKAADGRWCW